MGSLLVSYTFTEVRSLNRTTNGAHSDTCFKPEFARSLKVGPVEGKSDAKLAKTTRRAHAELGVAVRQC